MLRMVTEYYSLWWTALWNRPFQFAKVISVEAVIFSFLNYFNIPKPDGTFCQILLKGSSFFHITAHASKTWTWQQADLSMLFFLFTGNKQYSTADPVPVNWASSPFFGALPLLIRLFTSLKSTCLILLLLLGMTLLNDSQIRIVFQIPQSISSTKKHFNKWCWEKWISTYRGMKLDCYFSACTKNLS